MKEIWEKQYNKKEPPWNYDKFDKDLSEFFRARHFGTRKFSVIDLGCGNGAQAHYIEKSGNKDMKWLILPLKKDGSPWHERFMDRYNDNISNKKEEYLQHVFARDYDSIIRTMK